MAEDIKRGAVRIITDLHTPLEKFDRPGVNNVSRGEVYREVRVLATVDLSLARMLDEFDGKLETMNEGLFGFADDVRNDILALNVRLEQLEARTWSGRWRRFRAWWDSGFEKLEADIVEVASTAREYGIDTSGMDRDPLTNIATPRVER